MLGDEMASPRKSIQNQRSGHIYEVRRWKCSLSLVLMLGAILLAAAPLPRNKRPPPQVLLRDSRLSSTPEIPKAVNEKLAQLDKDVKAASPRGQRLDAVSAALVLMMTGPGLALFYGGLVRRKNTLAIMMQSFALMALITVMWALVATACASAAMAIL